MSNEEHLGELARWVVWMKENGVIKLAVDGIELELAPKEPNTRPIQVELRHSGAVYTS